MGKVTKKAEKVEESEPVKSENENTEKEAIEKDKHETIQLIQALRAKYMAEYKRIEYELNQVIGIMGVLDEMETIIKNAKSESEAKEA